MNTPKIAQVIMFFNNRITVCAMSDISVECAHSTNVVELLMCHDTLLVSSEIGYRRQCVFIHFVD